MISKENEKFINLQKQRLAIQRQLESEAIEAFKPLLKNYKGPEKMDTKITEEMVKDYEEEKKKPVEVDGKLYKNHPLLDDLELEEFEPIDLPADIEDTKTIEGYKEEVNRLKNDIDEYEQTIKDRIAKSEEKINDINVKLTDKKIHHRTRSRLIRDKNTEENRIEDLNKELNESLMKEETKRTITELQNRIRDNDVKLQKNYEENLAKKQQVEKINEERRNQRISTLQMLNTGRFDMTKDPNETTEAYLKRLEDSSKIQVNENVLKQEAEIENMKKLKLNLKDITRIDSRIENVVKSFPADDIYILNTHWPKIRKVYLENYGMNNKLTASEIVAILITMLDDIKKNGITEILTKVKSENVAPEDVEEVVSSTPSLKTIQEEKGLDTYIDLNIDYDNDLKALTVENGGATVFFKIINKKVNSKFIKYLSASYEPDEGGNGKYVIIRPTPRGGKLKEYANYLGIDVDRLRKNLGIPKEFLFTSDAIPYIEKKFPELGLHPLGTAKLIDVPNKIWGYGIQKLPSMCQFGKIYINIDKLYHNNILSVFNHNKNKILGFPNSRVSDSFVSLIMKICKNEHVAPRDINNLNVGEKEVFDHLLYISKLNKELKSASGDQTIEKLKNRLQIIEGEIESGNNNPEILRDLYDVLTKMVNFNLISQSEFKRYYKQMQKKINL